MTTEARRQLNRNAQARFRARKAENNLVQTTIFVPRNMIAEWRQLHDKLARLSNHTLVGITVRDNDTGCLATLKLG